MSAVVADAVRRKPAGPVDRPRPDAPAPGQEYRADVDGLRALAIIPVVAFHAFPALAPGGFVGVDVFFVISGYLISSIIFGGLERGRFSIAHFYARRIKRIFPALVLVLFTCLMWGWFRLFADDFSLLGKHTAGGAGFIANFLYWDEAGYFDVASDRKPLLHLWSLGIEEQFYLFWPTLLVLCWKRRVPILVVIALLLIGSFVFNAVVVRTDELAAFYSPATRLWELLLGAGLACLSRAHAPVTRAGRLSHFVELRGSRFADAASALGLSCLLGAVVLFNADTSFPGWRAALPAGGTLLVLAAGPDAWPNRRMLSVPALVWVGLISYPLYLWHWPLLSFARISAQGAAPVPLRLALVVASVILAWMTFALIERRVRFGPTGPLVVPALVGLTMLAGAAGYVTFAARGFIERPINRSDQAHFLRYYDRMRKDGRLNQPYRAECDFMDWQTEKYRAAIDPSCTQAGARGTVFLWGDSHAQALSQGIRSVLPDGFALAQVATSGCGPKLNEGPGAAKTSDCRVANGFALDRIAALEPDLVVMAQILDHMSTDWDAVAAALRSRGARDIILVGPAPQWHPILPEIVTRDAWWAKGFERVDEGLDPAILALDRTLNEHLRSSRLLRYVSLTEPLCDEAGCLATVPGTRRELMAIDAGHLSPAASIFVAETILRPYLPSRQ